MSSTRIPATATSEMVREAFAGDLPDESHSRKLADARSALMDTVRQLSLERHFSRSSLKAAEQLARESGKWRGPVAWFQPEGSHAQALQAESVESQMQACIVTVYLYPHLGDIVVESACTCEAIRCTHAAALLFRLQWLLDWPRPLTPTQRWQHSLKALSKSVPTSPAAISGHAQQAVCLLQPTMNRSPAEISARLVLVASDTDLAFPERCLDIEEAISAGVPLPPEVPVWQAQLSRWTKGPGTKRSGQILQGPEGLELVREWLRAGICRHAGTLEPIRAGTPRRPGWEWKLDAQANARLRLRWSEDESVRPIELHGLHYLDERHGELGEVVLPRSAWTMIKQMPPIGPGEVTLRQDWPPHPLLADVPHPPPAPVVRDIRSALTPILLISASRRLAREDFVFHMTAWADYEGCRIPLARDAWKIAVIRRIGTTYVNLHRQIELEIAARQALAAAELARIRKVLPDAWRALHPPPDADSLVHRQHCRGGKDTFINLESALRPLTTRGFRVEYDPELPFSILPEDTSLQANLSPAKAAGWTQFQLTAVCDGVTIDVLPIVLKGLERRAFSLTPHPHEPADARWLAPLGSDRFLPLSLSRLREWLSPIVMFLGNSTASVRSPMELPDALAMGLNDCLQRQDVAVEGPQAARIAETLAMLREAQKTTCPTPLAFRGTLRHYQTEGLQWLQSLRQTGLGGILADDMGLGKTVQVLAHMLAEAEAGRLTRPVLIIASTTLVFNWMDEIARFAPSLRCVDFSGRNRSLERERLTHAQVIIVSFAVLNIELSTLQALDYSMLVLDEGIKNPSTQTGRAVRTLRAPHRLVLTGTPLENHLGELWAHMNVVMPGYLGDERTFNLSFRIPIERHQDDQRMAALRQLVAPFVLRRTKVQVAPELPPKTEIVLRIVMLEQQRALYESLRLSLSHEVREALEEYSDSQSHIVVLTALMRLRQVCCDPRLTSTSPEDRMPGSAKLDALLTLVRTLRDAGRQVLVFSQFTSMLRLISTALQEVNLDHALLTGDTVDRRTPVSRFQNAHVGILLVSLKAGGRGLNLTAADAVIHYDPWWNPAVERQAADRAHRLGREQPVFIYKLLCEDTIEEKIAAMQDRKSELANAALGDRPARAIPLREFDIRTLFDLPAIR